MKKGFGWFFVILGGLNIIRGIGMLSEGMGGGILLVGVVFIILGAWMINTSKPNGDEKSTNDFSKSDNNNNLQQDYTITLRKKIEEAFEDEINETIKMTKGDDDLTKGLLIQATIANLCSSLKKADYGKLGIDKSDSDKIIDDITKEMLHKCFENY